MTQRNETQMRVSGADRGMSRAAEIAKHIRGRIKFCKIKARVRTFESCGSQVVQVNAPTADAVFAEHEQREIRLIAKVNGLTLVRGMPIDIEQMTNPQTFSFHIPEEKLFSSDTGASR